MRHFKLIFHNEYLDQALSFLESRDYPIFATVESDLETEVFTAFENERDALFEMAQVIQQFQAFDLGSGEIDWSLEWEKHAKDFKEGALHVDLKSYGKAGKELFLIPGPGFGDLSHPTTEMTLSLMADLPLHLGVSLDIGSGSGILALAAASWGAKQVIAIDIDPEAVLHTEQNAKLNHYETSIICLKAPLKNLSEKINPGEPLFIFMNMISSEQEEALKATPLPEGTQKHLITSGIRKDDLKEYLKKNEAKGWLLQKTLEQENWCACYFII